MAIERNKFDEKAQAFQKNIEDFRTQNERIEKVDLEKGFGELQNTLANIFNAINSINGTLTNVAQTLTNIVQTLGTIQTSISSKYEATIKHLTKQDIQATNNVEILKDKINILTQKHESFIDDILPQINQLTKENTILRKEIKTNRMIQIVGIVITIIIFLIIKFW